MPAFDRPDHEDTCLRHMRTVILALVVEGSEQLGHSDAPRGVQLELGRSERREYVV